MTKKQIKKKTKVEIALGAEDSHELQMIIDRLAVQDPGGESFERYLASLQHSLAARPELAAALIDKLSKNPSAAGFRTYSALKGSIEASPHRRALKQAAYRFGQRGFEVVREEVAGEKVVLIQKEARHPLTHFLPVDGTLWFVSGLFPASTPSGHNLFVSVFLEEEFKGIYARAGETSNRVYREYMQSLAEHLAGRKICDIPPWHAARLFFDILEFYGKEEAFPELARAREAFGPYYDPERKPYAYELMPEIEYPERRLPEVDIEKLLASGVDFSWLRFAREDLAPFQQRIQQLDSPILVVPPEIQAERSLDVVRSAADSLCVGKKRLLYQRFFEELAMYHKLSGKEDEALWAWIVAQHLRGEFAAGGNPAVFQMAIESLQYYWPEEYKKSEEAQPKEHVHRTESGIFLP